MKKQLLTFLIAGILLSLPFVVDAALLPSCTTSGNCHTCDFLVFIDNLASEILRYIGAIIILVFVIGGVFWIISGGSAERVKKGQTIMVGALIGLGFVFGAWMIVHMIIAAFVAPTTDTGATDWSKVSLFDSGQNWYEFCVEGTAPSGATTNCKDESDGTECQADSCTAVGVCVCKSDTCISLCQYHAEEAGQSGSCVDEVGDCSGVTDSSTGLCPGETICCRVDS